jgi:protein-S-isoprenylcysteine O-methyltransferase Ste14
VAQGQGTPAPFDAPRNFVAIGPYRCVRNPTYIGALTVLVGFGLYEYSVSILLLCLVVFALVHLFIVVYEERG